MKKSDEPIVVEQQFNNSIDEVWGALTELDQMLKWYFDNIPEFRAEVGFTTEFTIENEGRVFPHKWKVTEVIPQKKIAYNWSFENYEGSSDSVFELFEEDGYTKLKLSVIIHEDFNDDIPEFKRESCVGGWNYFLNGRLKEYLDGKG